MSIKLSDEQWKPIDEGILRREILKNMQAIRETASVSLHEAMKLYFDRYKVLRESRASEFVCSDEKYWEGFYS